ncbi:hypothetical protein, partial [Mesorhizobium sp.]|uniref:hypothetical protein n=1 Tax=Mesorhizobium sp. TaxID=1871066 RepID=UPI00257DB987
RSIPRWASQESLYRHAGKNLWFFASLPRHARLKRCRLGCGAFELHQLVGMRMKNSKTTNDTAED